jgi:hypothetical protein
MTTLDQKGFPVLTIKDLELATISKVAEGRPGNDFHDRSGKFTFSPAGVKVLGGEQLLKRLDESSKIRLAQYAKIARPNQMIARETEIGKLKTIFMRDGRFIAEFELEMEPENGKKNKPEDVLVKEFASSGELRDYIIDVARDLGLQGDSLENFIKRESRDAELSPGDLASIINMVESTRVNDFVDYLHYQLRVHTGKEKPKDELRMAAGRGYRKKLWRMLSVQQAQEVLTRLQARGWQEGDVQEFIIDTMPERLKKVINVPSKESNLPSQKERTER